MVFLLILAFLTIWIMVGNNEREPNWRLALIQALIVWGTYAIVGTEILSLFSLITRSAVAIMWAVPIIAGILWGWIWLRKGKALRLPIVYHRDSWAGTILDLLLILILIVTAVVAFFAPPNSSSVEMTSLSRVAHWAQNQSLAHYATGIETQNSNAPVAEILQLQYYLLADNDRMINMVAWISFAGMAAAAASLAEVLGAKINGQRMAAIFSATIPAAITQATSSMNNVVVSFWIVSAVLMLLTYTRSSAKPFNLVLAALAAALAIATKATAFIFLWPFALYMIVVLLQRKGLPKMMLWALAALVIMGVINGGYFWRNQVAYGQFYRPAELENQTNDIRNWKVLVSNLTRNAALHADLPFPRAENWLNVSILELHENLGISESDPSTTVDDEFYIPTLNTSERTSGNPLHAMLIIFSFVFVIGMVVLGKEDPGILVYAGSIFFSLLLFCYMLKWQPTNGQLHLPYFVLFAPLVAILLDKLAKFKIETLIAVLLLVYCVPWLFMTKERPVIPLESATSPIGVFSGQREALYFVTNPEDYEPYLAITNTIRATGITDVGLDLTADSEEYPFWVLLGAPSTDLRVEWVDTQTVSERLVDPDFSPQAIICENCSSEKIDRYREAYRQISFDRFDLFITNGGD
jgi:4-amino-4-deoxy-L-arabinose transferase-like glycosyltransferase